MFPLSRYECWKKKKKKKEIKGTQQVLGKQFSLKIARKQKRKIFDFIKEWNLLLGCSIRVEHRIVSPSAPQSAHSYRSTSSSWGRGECGLRGALSARCIFPQQKTKGPKGDAQQVASRSQSKAVFAGAARNYTTASRCRREKLGVQRAHAGGAGRDAQEGLQQDNSHPLPWPIQEPAGRSTLTLRMISKKGQR